MLAVSVVSVVSMCLTHSSPSAGISRVMVMSLRDSAGKLPVTPSFQGGKGGEGRRERSEGEK